LAHVPRHQGAKTVVDVVGGVAGEPRLADRRPAVPGHVVVGLHAQIAAELEAGVGAGDIVEAIPVQIADLHILDWLGVRRHVGGVRSTERDESRGSANQKTPHFAHFEPPRLFREQPEIEPESCLLSITERRKERHFQWLLQKCSRICRRA
jgi:hypothetical protein